MCTLHSYIHTICTNMHTCTLLTMIHTLSSPPPSQPTHAAAPLVFGVPLVDLVTREGRAIPYIVQKIVEHMEEEGEEGGREGG